MVYNLPPKKVLLRLNQTLEFQNYISSSNHIIVYIIL